MADNMEIVNAAVSLLVRATLLAARFSGRVHQRSLKRLASRDVDAKAKELLFLKDRVYQLEMQVSILQKHLGKKGRRPRYTVREKLLILWHIEAFQIPRRKVSRYFGIARSIPAWYPNHVWSVDTTKVRCWGLWSIDVLVAIDHFSRKVVCVAPLEGPNAGWIIEALERTMRDHGAPKHIISDQAPVFTGDASAELLRQWSIKPRFGAVGKHGSIAVTERVIKTLKYEWLRCVPIIKGFDHLASLRTEFEHRYNGWRPHMTLDGFRSDDLYYSRQPSKPKRNAKTVLDNIERHVFLETRLTAYRLKNAA